MAQQQQYRCRGLRKWWVSSEVHPLVRLRWSGRLSPSAHHTSHRSGVPCSAGAHAAGATFSSNAISRLPTSCSTRRCQRRCEATSPAEPTGWPVAGFYCGLHAYQRPRQQPDGSLAYDSPAIETFIRRSTSFSPPEAGLAAELLKAPGIVRDRPGAGRNVATGLAVLNWLIEARRLDEGAARAVGQRMVACEVLQPVDGGRAFAPAQNALYRVVVGGGGRGGAQLPTS